MIFYSIFIIKFSWNFWINHFELLLSSHSKYYVMPFKNHFGWSLRKPQLILKTGQNGLKLVRNAFSNGYSSLKIDYIFWSIKLYTLYQTKLYYNLAKVMMSSKFQSFQIYRISGAIFDQIERHNASDFLSSISKRLINTVR